MCGTGKLVQEHFDPLLQPLWIVARESALDRVDTHDGRVGQLDGHSDVHARLADLSASHGAVAIDPDSEGRNARKLRSAAEEHPTDAVLLRDRPAG
jgi:hypothetical protein